MTIPPLSERACLSMLRVTFSNAAHTLLIALVVWVSAISSAFSESLHSQDEGLFLVATEQLNNSEFQHAVILLTHFSDQGATGLTINRPTDIALKEAFPNVPQLKHRTDPLYLGGPVSTNAIFVLIQTDTPHSTMHLIAKNIYFSTAKNAFTRPLANTARTYAGYAGWGPGQLQHEISRGDWLIVHTDPKIIFEEKTATLWNHLIKRWSGNWI